MNSTRGISRSPIGNSSLSHPAAGLRIGLGIALAAATLAAPGLLYAQDGNGTATVTLEQALSTAFERSPRLESARAAVAEAEGRLVGAKTYPFNPSLRLNGASRDRSVETTADYGVSVSQRIEIAGQRGHRIDAARAEISVAKAALQREQRLLAAEVSVAFIEALAARDRAKVAHSEMELVGTLFELSERRLAEGSGTQLDVNVATAELGRAEQQDGSARGDYMAARAVLAESLGMEASALPKPDGSLTDKLDSPTPELKTLLEAAQQNRADLLAFRHIEDSVDARLELARTSVWPSINLNLFANREESTYTILGGGVSFSIPLFQRNQGAIAQGQAQLRSVRAERDSARLAVLREVVTEHSRYRAARDSAERLRDRVLGSLMGSIELLQRSFSAGKSTWVDVLVMRRSFFDAHRALIESSATALRARVRLDLAAGQMPFPASNPPKDPTP